MTASIRGDGAVPVELKIKSLPEAIERWMLKALSDGVRVLF